MNTLVIAIAGLIFVSVVIILLFVRGRNQPLQSNPNMVLDSVPNAPPLPETGLPQGWTMEQWAWYGEDYLKNN